MRKEGGRDRDGGKEREREGGKRDSISFYFSAIGGWSELGYLILPTFKVKHLTGRSDDSGEKPTIILEFFRQFRLQIFIIL